MPTHPAPPSSPAARPFSLLAQGLTVHRADRPVLVDVDLTVTERSRLAVVGPNGVGKSTLLALLAGRLEPDRGRIEAAPPDLIVGLLDQEPLAGERVGAVGADTDRAEGTVRDLVASRVGVAGARDELEAAAVALADRPTGAGSGAVDPAERYDRALAHYLALGAADLDARLEATADRIGLNRALLDAAPGTLSGGEAERVGLALVMVSRFDLTLLDEPTNNLDLDGLALLEDWVLNHPGGLVVVSHDRAFLERTISSVLELDGHHHTATLFNGGWGAYREERARAAEHALVRYDRYVDERDRLRIRAQQQREWAAQGASRARKQPADNDKNIQRFRVAQTEKLAAKARATERAAERLEEVDKPWEPWRLQLTIEQAPRSATVVAALDGAVFRRGDFELGPIDVEVRWADRVAVVGSNGSGKTTLLAGLLGHLPPVAGGARLGSGVVVGALGQSRDALTGSDPDRPLQRAVQDLTGGTVTETRSLLAKFGLDGEATTRPPGSLSPGERTRALLALFQARGVNLVVLDEPTNHLDLEAIEQLELALQSYGGTLIVVSHDRRFLDAVALTTTLDLGHTGSAPVAAR